MSAEQLVQIDRVFRSGGVVPAVAPSRFYVSLTETCNLRCAHCITSAPARTEDGTARVMTRAVLDALAPHLAHATYVGLTHAGEPTTAPMLVPLLEALVRARGGARSIVHVVTNGHGLGERRFLELVGLGVSSWSFSIDGVTPATHDALRVRSKIDELLDRLRGLAALRRARALDVRLSLAWTVTRSNARELDALLTFAADEGLDAVKLEELVPVNDVAARESLEPEALAAAVSAAEVTAARVGVALLDHTRSPEVYKCRLDRDDRMRRFSLLDDRVNRVEINGCRMPWEVVCVEPNGDVRPMSFHHGVAGNLVETDLGELWRSPSFILERTRSMLKRPCGRGPVTCSADPGPEAW